MRSKAVTSPADRERLRGYVGLAWDWLIAKVRAFVRITDTGLALAYRLFRRMTADWLEPYIRVAAVTVTVGLVAWALYTIKHPPKPHITIPAMDHFVAMPKLPSVIVTTPLPLPAAVQALPPMEKTIKAVEVMPKKVARKRKPKPKCDAVFC